MAGPTRIELARRRLRVTRIAVGALAAAGFAVFSFAARTAHPGTTAGTAGSSAPATAVTSQDDAGTTDDFGFGSSSLSPSYGETPSIQSGGS
jgi:hypothetical protein